MNENKLIVELEGYLKDRKIEYSRDFKLAMISYLKSGGAAPLYLSPDNTKDFVDTICYCSKNGIRFVILGNASNCLFKDDMYDAVFISTKRMALIAYNQFRRSVTVDAGLMLPAFVNEVSRNRKTGFEGLSGIPGTIGGAIYMNAGAYGNEIADHIEDILICDQSGNKKTLTKIQAEFGFRQSIFQKRKDWVILSAKFNLKEGDLAEITNKIALCKSKRSMYQESVYPNLGSLFRTRDIYADIAKNSAIFGMVLWVMRKLSRIYGRKNNRFLNAITKMYYGLEYDSEKPYSDKTLNCLVNRGHLDFRKAMDFIKKMKAILGNKVELEIEVIE